MKITKTKAAVDSTPLDLDPSTILSAPVRAKVKPSVKAKFAEPLITAAVEEVLEKGMEKIACAIPSCKFRGHIIVPHLLEKHEMQPVAYLELYPKAPLWSGYGYSFVQKHSTSFRAKTTPRPRKEVELKTLFPDIGVKKGYEYDGSYPIFATRDAMTPARDATYVFPEEQLIDFITIIEKPKRNRVYIKGWSGTGKTMLTRQVAAVLNAPLLEWNADAYQQRTDIVGRWTVKDGQTIWQDGLLVRAMRYGYWLVIHEFDTISPLAANILKPVLEDPSRITIMENGGEVVEAHPDFRCIATANTWARGDSSGLFVNTHTQSDADARRWSARILLDYMEPTEEEGLIKLYMPDIKDDEISKFVLVANKVREAFKAGKIDKTFSPAELVTWAENYSICGRGVHHAARLSFLNALEPDVYTAVSEMINIVFGQEKIA